MVPWAPRVHIPSGISISSAVFVGRSRLSLTETQTVIICTDTLHLCTACMRCGQIMLESMRLEVDSVTTGEFANYSKKVAHHTRLPSVGFRSWFRFLVVSLQVTWVINQAVGCHYFPPGPQLPSQPLRGLLPVLLLGEQRHNGCEQFTYDYYSTASRLRFEPGPFCTLTTRYVYFIAWVNTDGGHRRALCLLYVTASRDALQCPVIQYDLQIHPHRTRRLTTGCIAEKLYAYNPL